MAKYVFLEGGIGVGKSSLACELMARHPDWNYFPEPVEKWQDWNGRNMLKLYYEDPKRYAFEFQNIILDSYASLKSYQSGIVLCERSPRSSVRVFSVLLKAKGYITEEEHQRLLARYKEEFSFLEDIYCRLTIYLHAPPMIIYTRMKDRARAAEIPIGMDYVTGLSEAHDKEFFANEKPFDWVLSEFEGEIDIAEKVVTAEEYVERWLEMPEYKADGIEPDYGFDRDVDDFEFFCQKYAGFYSWLLDCGF